jgi:hypothetical protein
VHFSGFCAPVWIGCVLFAGNRWLRTGASLCSLAAGALLGLATWGPWLHWQHYANQWNDLRQLQQAAKGKSEFSFVALADYYQSMLHSGRLDYWFQTPTSELPEYFPTWLAPVCWTAAALTLAATALALRRSLDSSPARLLLLWCALPVAMLLVLRPLVHPHYVLVAFPAPFLLIGAWAQRWACDRVRRIVLAASLTFVSAAHVLLMVGWHRYLDADRLTGRDRYQLSYRQRRAAAIAILDDAGQRQIDIAGPFSGQQPAYQYPYLFELNRRSGGRWGVDQTHRYWMDESPGDSFSDAEKDQLARFPPYFSVDAVEKQWRVGPSRIIKLRGVARGPMN